MFNKIDKQFDEKFNKEFIKKVKDGNSIVELFKNESLALPSEIRGFAKLFYSQKIKALTDEIEQTIKDNKNLEVITGLSVALGIIEKYNKEN